MIGAARPPVNAASYRLGTGIPSSDCAGLPPTVARNEAPSRTGSCTAARRQRERISISPI